MRRRQFRRVVRAAQWGKPVWIREATCFSIVVPSSSPAGYGNTDAFALLRGGTGVTSDEAAVEDLGQTWRIRRIIVGVDAYRHTDPGTNHSNFTSVNYTWGLVVARTTATGMGDLEEDLDLLNPAMLGTPPAIVNRRQKHATRWVYRSPPFQFPMDFNSTSAAAKAITQNPRMPVMIDLKRPTQVSRLGIRDGLFFVQNCFTCQAADGEQDAVMDVSVNWNVLFQND